jgi:hypothetical protein
MSTTYYCNSSALVGGHQGTQNDPWDMVDLFSYSNPATNGDTILLDVTADLPADYTYFIWINNSHVFCNNSGNIININKWHSDPWRIRIYGNFPSSNPINLTAAMSNGILNIHDNQNQFIVINSPAINMNFINSDTTLSSVYFIITKPCSGCNFITGMTANKYISINVSTPTSITDSVFSTPLLEASSGNVTLNNCASTSPTPLSGITSNHCQYNLPTPAWPLWNANKSLWSSVSLANQITSPTEPGNPPYVGYSTDPWGNNRTGIGAFYMPISIETFDLSSYLDVVDFSISSVLPPVLSADYTKVTLTYTGNATPTNTGVNLTTYQYSLDGINWSPMTVASGSVISGVTFSSIGNSYPFIWSIRHDIGTNIYNIPIQVRFQATATFASNIVSTGYKYVSVHLPKILTISELVTQSVFSPEYSGTAGYSLMKNAPKVMD